MKKKVLVLGKMGMLGHMILRVLSKLDDFLVFGTQRDAPEKKFYFNAEKGMGPFKKIYDENRGFDYFINCIGINNYKINRRNVSSVINAIRINSLFPHMLAKFAERNNAKVIHISTDGVFSGRRGQYTENSSCDCSDIYGKTKGLGEANSNSLINIRCSMLGPSPFEKRGLLEWFLSQKDGGAINGYTNNIWNGVTTLQFAKLCAGIIKENKFDRLRELSPVFHFTPNQPISKYELLLLLKSAFAKNININPAEDRKGKVSRILKSDYEAIRSIYPQGILMKDAIEELSDFINMQGNELLERRK